MPSRRHRLLFLSHPIIFFSVILKLETTDSLPACDSPVFCHGQLLATVQNASIFSDSKEFVDRPLSASPDTVLAAFERLPDPQNTSAIREFVEKWTAVAGSDLEIWDPPDWNPKPTFVDKIKDEKLKEWALNLNSIWRQLGRKIAASVADKPDRHSLLHLPNPFVVPGGRFREIYYWDTYWIVEGLLLCGMNDTARGMIENLGYLVQQYGLVPNGGRQYYTRRSQPPLLTQMVELFYNKTGDSTFLHTMLPALVKEYDFWITNRSSPDPVYRAPTNGPRPEAYRQDLATAANVPFDKREELYQELASGAESGWDFSSRWLAHSGSQRGQLSSISVSTILPVDLSAILCANEATLARLFTAIGNESEASYYREQEDKRRAMFDTLFWNESLGLWKDRGETMDPSLNGSFYGSSFAPLVWRCGLEGARQDEKFRSTLESLGVLEYPGGIPASEWRESGLQWDYPNVWGPLQWMLVMAWHDSPNKTLSTTAERVARTWLTTTYLAWGKYNNTMFEKYNCTVAGEPGGGSQYSTQVGFGWTNAVALKFLDLYPDVSLPPDESSSSQQDLGWVSVIVLLVIAVAVSIPCLLWCRWIYTTGRDRYWGRVRNEHLIAAQGGRSHSRPHSPHHNNTYTNIYASDNDIIGNNSDNVIYNETLLEFDV